MKHWFYFRIRTIDDSLKSQSLALQNACVLLRCTQNHSPPRSPTINSYSIPTPRPTSTAPKINNAHGHTRQLPLTHLRHIELHSP